MKYFLLFFYVFCFIFIFLKLSTLIDDIGVLKQKNDIYGSIKGSILNKETYKDEILTVKDVVSVSREVYRYQWTEIQETSSKIATYNYKKIWSRKPIDSSNFRDKTKNNNVDRSIYEETFFILNNIETKNHTINKNYYIKKIKLTPIKFKKKEFSGKIIEDSFDINKESFTDLDSYLSYEDGRFAKYKRDKFIVIDDGILFNGKNIKEPEIGDTIIVYKAFKPNYIYFFGELNKELSSYKGYFAITFEDNLDKNIKQLKNKIIFSVVIGITLIFLFIDLIVCKLSQLKLFTLKYVPFFNEYFIYSKKKYFNIFCLFFFFILIIFNLYYLSAIPAILLFIARQVDYFSI